MSYAFTTNVPLRSGELVIMSMEQSGVPYLWACDSDGEEYDITKSVPGIFLEDNEVVLNHDLMGEINSELAGDVVDYLAFDTKEIVFGPWGCKTLVLKLKDNWRELVVPMEA